MSPRHSDQAVQVAQVAPATAPSAPRPGLIGLPVLLVAALVASPAAYRASQGLLTVDQAIVRFLLVAVACVAASLLVRGVWPLVAGPIPTKGPDPATTEPTEATGSAGVGSETT